MIQNSTQTWLNLELKLDSSLFHTLDTEELKENNNDQVITALPNGNHDNDTDSSEENIRLGLS